MLLLWLLHKLLLTSRLIMYIQLGLPGLAHDFQGVTSSAEASDVLRRLAPA